MLTPAARWTISWKCQILQPDWSIIVYELWPLQKFNVAMWSKYATEHAVKQSSVSTRGCCKYNHCYITKAVDMYLRICTPARKTSNTAALVALLMEQNIGSHNFLVHCSYSVCVPKCTCSCTHRNFILRSLPVPGSPEATEAHLHVPGVLRSPARDASLYWCCCTRAGHPRGWLDHPVRPTWWP